MMLMLQRMGETCWTTPPPTSSPSSWSTSWSTPSSTSPWSWSTGRGQPAGWNTDVQDAGLIYAFFGQAGVDPFHPVVSVQLCRRCLLFKSREELWLLTGSQQVLSILDDKAKHWNLKHKVMLMETTLWQCSGSWMGLASSLTSTPGMMSVFFTSINFIIIIDQQHITFSLSSCSSSSLMCFFTSPLLLLSHIYYKDINCCRCGTFFQPWPSTSCSCSSSTWTRTSSSRGEATLLSSDRSWAFFDNIIHSLSLSMTID